MMKRPRRNINFQWDPTDECPLRIISDPWEEGLLKTTLSLTQYEAELLAGFLTNHTN